MPYGACSFADFLPRAGGPRDLGVPHSIAFCAIEWDHDAACNTKLSFRSPQTLLPLRAALALHGPICGHPFGQLSELTNRYAAPLGKLSA